MKNNLVESVNSYFTIPAIGHLSAVLGEPDASVGKAIFKSVPIVLKGLQNRLEHGYPPETLLELVQTTDFTKSLKQTLSLKASEWHEPNSNLPYSLLGDAYSSTVNQIAEGAGLRPATYGTLMQVVAMAVLGALGKVVVKNNFSATELSDWLRSQKNVIDLALLKTAIDTAQPHPRPIAETERNLSRQLEANMQALSAPPPWPKSPPYEAVSAHSPGWLGPPLSGPAFAATGATGATGLRWQWGALLLLAVCLGFIFGSGYFSRPLSGNGSKNEGMESASLVSGNQASATGNKPIAASNNSGAAPGRYDKDRDTYIYDIGRPIKLTLANGTTLKVGANSTENRLYTFLASPVEVDSVNRTKGWINFDRINFEPGKATLTPESAPQLDNIARIIKSFPNAVVKIGGYTDSTGSADLNYQLSDDRARAAMLALARRGVSPDRLQAKGYGPKYFVMPNNTPIGRALNRRVSIRVVKK
ncbi:OmpA family protein [Hymenobacter sp. BT770]|uniref:OmpA family protein n=1 Tax=Hymenobacter sp. BT770 TaxID=2886942 RepID=UPI001D11F7B2|nr:OmpA family protein [Hymenobacter sp. BT770]MCC3153173.1 OmpA family protein [Hymenobacter sp. BT770]MDO3415353.1 OmpA family protein [Hymenobacter sp. BT770]